MTNVRVARDHPPAECLAPLDGCAALQLSVGRIWIGDEPPVVASAASISESGRGESYPVMR